MADEGKAKILVVDDEPDAVEFVKTVLEEAGYEVVSASNGVQGLEKAQAELPNLIILDVQMPEKDGFATFGDLRRDPQLKEIPVIMLTGVGEKVGISFSAEDMGDYLGASPEAYVDKPISPGELVEKVEELLGA